MSEGSWVRRSPTDPLSHEVADVGPEAQHAHCALLDEFMHGVLPEWALVRERIAGPSSVTLLHPCGARQQGA
jgi:hypothetical protein